MVGYNHANKLTYSSLINFGMRRTSIGRDFLGKVKLTESLALSLLN